MKSLMSLWSITCHEMAVRCCTSATRDVKTVSSRVEHEGLSFLAITLADFGKAIQKWLDQGFVDSSDVPAFKRAGPRSRLPAFLQGFCSRVFDPCSGALLDDPDIEAIYAIRQLTLMFSKIALPEATSDGSLSQVVTPGRERRAMTEYVQCEQEVKFADSILDPSYKEDFRRVSAVLFGRLFDELEETLAFSNLLPKHGPGAVADRLSSNAKFSSLSWTSRLQRVFPAEDYLVPSSRYSASAESPRMYCESATAHCYSVSVGKFDFLEPGDEIPVRVVSVPKTLKTPRIIAIEPTCMQYMQQALFRLIRDGIERHDFLSLMIGIDDQNPNRVLARRGSLSGDLATLDLSEASDRVSNQHVRELFSQHPLLLEAVDATRSRKADVPGHGVLRLAKFASMGSALCFPIEAMVFLTLVFLGIERARGRPFSKKSEFNDYLGAVRVYGDDIIVPVDSVHSVVHTLEHFGARVGVAKSFWIGKFRESCGKEYYDGFDVSYVKVRRMLPTKRRHVDEIISSVSLRNQLYFAGHWRAVKFLDDRIGKILKYFPYVLPTSSVLGRNSFLGYETEKICENLQAPMVKGFVVSAKSPFDPLDGHGALLKFFLKRGSLPTADRDHLERAGRPRAVNIKPRFSSPF